MRRFRWWLSDLLERLAYMIQPAPTGERLDLGDLLKNIEPTDTPFLRQIVDR